MHSIRRQLTRKLLGAVLLILLGGIGALYFGAREVATDQFDRTVRAKALAISSLTFQTPDGFRFEFTDRFLRGFDSCCLITCRRAGRRGSDSISVGARTRGCELSRPEG